MNILLKIDEMKVKIENEEIIIWRNKRKGQSFRIVSGTCKNCEIPDRRLCIVGLKNHEKLPPALCDYANKIICQNENKGPVRFERKRK